MRLSPLVQAGWADASGVESVPLVPARAEPFVFFAGRPSAQRAPDARWFRSAGLLVFLRLTVRNDDRTVSDRSHALCSLDSVFFAKCAPILSDHAYFLPTESGVLDRYA